MQELRLVAVSEDGTYLVLATAGRGTRFTLPVDDRLRAAVRGHFSRLGQFEIEVESPLRPKEIQARIRAGETAEEIAESAGIPVERVRWFEGPVLQEREYMAQQAQRVPVRRPGESAPGPPLGELVEERLNRGGVDLEDVEWDSWKCEDSSWRVRLSFFDEGRPHAAEWMFDPRRRHLSPLDEVAARLSGQEWEDGSADEAGDTVTPLLPRRPAMKIVSDPRDVAPPAPAVDPRREYAIERGRMADPRPQPGIPPSPLQAPREMTAAAPPAPVAPRPPAAPLAPAPPAPAVHERPAAPVPPPEQAPGPAARQRPAQPVPAASRPDAEAPREEEPPAETEAAAPEAAGTEAETAVRQAPAAEEPATGETAESTEPAQPTESTQPVQPAQPTGAEALAEDEAPAGKPEAEAPAPEPRAEPEQPAAAEPRPVAQPEPPRPRPRRDKAPGRPAAPAAGSPAGEPAAATARDVPVPAAQQQRQQPAARRRKSKGKRASVPSWDEIMFGARRPD